MRAGAKVYPQQGADGGDDVGDIIRAIDKDMESFAAPSSSAAAAASSGNAASATRRKSIGGSDGGGQASRRNSDDNSNSADTEKVVKFTHEIDDFAVVTAQATEELKRQFAALKDQLEEYKSRYSKAAEKLQTSEAAKRELEDRVDSLEEELQTGGGASAFAGTVGLGMEGEDAANTEIQKSSLKPLSLKHMQKQSKNKQTPEQPTRRLRATIECATSSPTPSAALLTTMLTRT